MNTNSSGNDGYSYSFFGYHCRVYVAFCMVGTSMQYFIITYWRIIFTIYDNNINNRPFFFCIYIVYSMYTKILLTKNIHFLFLFLRKCTRQTFAIYATFITWSLYTLKRFLGSCYYKIFNQPIWSNWIHWSQQID